MLNVTLLRQIFFRVQAPVITFVGILKMFFLHVLNQVRITNQFFDRNFREHNGTQIGKFEMVCIDTRFCGR